MLLFVMKNIGTDVDVFEKQTVTSPTGESLPMFEEVYIPAVNRIGEADSESTIVSALIQCTYSKQEVTDDDE